MKEVKVEVGDWVRFMRGGCLVIGSVAYLVPRASWDSTIELMTAEHGQVGLDDVVECRKPLPPEPPTP